MPDAAGPLLAGLLNLTPGGLLMVAVGGLLIYLAVARDYEPMLLLPIGAGRSSPTCRSRR
jgi:carboxybiotin decarboxylase